MPWIRTRDGAHLHYHDLGRGRPVILLHGFGMRSEHWLPFLPGLTGRYRFILPSLRGFGRSHCISLAQPSVLDQHADDLADLLDQLELDDVLLGGLSMGACTGLQYHRRHGFDRVRAYLHIDQAPRVKNTPDWPHGLLGADQAHQLGAWQAAMEALTPYRGLGWARVPSALQQQLIGNLRRFLQYAFSTRTWLALSRAAPAPVLKTLMPTANWTIYLDVLKSYLSDDYDWRDSLARLTRPMRVIVGMDSKMYPAEGQLMIRRFAPKAEIVPVAGSGHAVPFEAPRRFRTELARFLTDFG